MAKIMTWHNNGMFSSMIINVATAKESGENWRRKAKNQRKSINQRKKAMIMAKHRSIEIEERE